MTPKPTTQPLDPALDLGLDIHQDQPLSVGQVISDPGGPLDGQVIAEISRQVATPSPEPAFVPPPAPPSQSPAERMLEMALAQNCDLTRLQTLIEMKERWDKEEARKAFLSAMAEFRANAPSLGKGSKVDFKNKDGVRTNYAYADLEEVSMPIGRVMGPLGLSFRWEVKQEGPKIFVTTILQHSMGHSEHLTLEGPADGSGNKNAIQAVGSTMTFLERYGLLAITGMATKDQDDDGRGGAGGDDVVDMDEGVFQAHLQAIKTAVDLAALSKAFNASYPATSHRGSKESLLKAKEIRQTELKKAGGQ